jgi:hypothetical protein
LSDKWSRRSYTRTHIRACFGKLETRAVTFYIFRISEHTRFAYILLVFVSVLLPLCHVIKSSGKIFASKPLNDLFTALTDNFNRFDSRVRRGFNGHPFFFLGDAHRKPGRGSRILRRRETRRRLRPTAFDERLTGPSSASFTVALYCRTHSDNHAISAGSSVHEISSPLLLTTIQVHSSLTYANPGPSFSHRSIRSPWNRVAMTECKGEPNRSVQRPNFPSVSTAKHATCRSH